MDLLIIGVAAIVVLLIIIASKGSKGPARSHDLIFCHSCNKPRRADSASCPNCGAGAANPNAGHKKCIMCSEWILPDAAKCKHCGEMQVVVPDSPATETPPHDQQPVVTSSTPVASAPDIDWSKVDRSNRNLGRKT